MYRTAPFSSDALQVQETVFLGNFIEVTLPIFWVTFLLGRGLTAFPPLTPGGSEPPVPPRGEGASPQKFESHGLPIITSTILQLHKTYLPHWKAWSLGSKTYALHLEWKWIWKEGLFILSTLLYWWVRLAQEKRKCENGFARDSSAASDISTSGTQDPGFLVYEWVHQMTC